MKKQLRITLAGGGTRLANETVDNVKAMPEALAISEFNEAAKDYHPLLEKRDGVWISPGANAIYS